MSERHGKFHQKSSAGVDTPRTASGESKCQTSDGPTQKFYALIIGIDNYPDPDLNILKGAVADANEMEYFLVSDLGVPEEQIITLHNQQATRSRIIQAFQALWQNKNIQRGDPILVYYAGHGGLAKANRKWKERYGAHQIQVIFPFDYRQKGQDRPGAKGTIVNCIPDKTIAKLLNKLATEKGDNITVIFDSCHAASGTRDKLGQHGRRHRSANAELDIPHNIDDDLFASIGIETPLEDKQQRDAQLPLHSDQSSHVHLAACGIREKASEEDGRGLFTTALLKEIREAKVDKITYENLLKGLEAIDNQSPQCYGINKERILFDARISSRNVIRVNLKDDAWVLDAGAASGVIEGSIWTFHRTSAENSESVGYFRAIQVYAAVTVLKPLDPDFEWVTDDNRCLYARCMRVGRGNSDELVLKVWISPSDRVLLFGGLVFKGKFQESGIGFIITSTRDSAEVALEVSPSVPKQPGAGERATQAKVTFHLCDSLARQHRAETLHQRVPAHGDKVEIVLFAVARWRWHLRRGNFDAHLAGRMVSMSMVKVGNSSGPGLPAKHLPKPQPMRTLRSSESGPNQTTWSILDDVKNMINCLSGIDLRSPPTSPAPSSLVVEGVVEFTVDSSLYGFKLKSDVPSPLYVRMFYFDTADFSIRDMFGHNTGNGEGIHDIPRGGELLIGNRGDGGAPITFSLSSEQSVELGYMKVFWSTRPLELDHIKQKSAFEMKPGDIRGANLSKAAADDMWGTVTLGLVLKK